MIFVLVFNPGKRREAESGVAVGEAVARVCE